jgi:hypothetical protein
VKVHVLHLAGGLTAAAWPRPYITCDVRLLGGTSFGGKPRGGGAYKTLRRCFSTKIHHISALQLTQQATLPNPTNNPPKQPTTCPTACARASASRRLRRVRCPHSLTHSSLPRRHHANPLPVKPDSTKSNTEKAGESISGLGDKAASAVQPGTSPLFPHYLYHIH